MTSYSKVYSITVRDLCEKGIAYYNDKIEKIREKAIKERMTVKKYMFRSDTYSRSEAEKDPRMDMEKKIEIHVYRTKVSRLEDLIALSNLSKEVHVSIEDSKLLDRFQ